MVHGNVINDVGKMEQCGLKSFKLHLHTLVCMLLISIQKAIQLQMTFLPSLAISNISLPSPAPGTRIDMSFLELKQVQIKNIQTDLTCNNSDFKREKSSFIGFMPSYGSHSSLLIMWSLLVLHSWSTSPPLLQSSPLTSKIP